MIRRWFPFLFCLTIVLSAAHFSAARRSSLRINEAAIKLHFIDQQADVVFVLDNNTGASFAARIEIELLDARDEVLTNTVLKETIRTGTSSITMPLVFHYAGLNETERRKLPLYRLRYRVAPAAVENSTINVEGVVSLSEITPDFLSCACFRPVMRAGAQYRVRVRALHPVTLRPVRNVHEPDKPKAQRSYSSTHIPNVGYQ